MKWQSIYREIIDSLRADGLQGFDNRDTDVGRTSKDATTAFRRIRKTMNDLGYSAGWNKICRGNDILGWYGNLIITLPLRAIALEIEADKNMNEAICEFLYNRWQNRESGKSPSEISNPSKEVLYYLYEFGIRNPTMSGNSIGLKLLHRLNSDRREQPFIERWKWAGNTGTAQLSDGGRFQIRREAVWARAIEGSLDKTKGMSDAVVSFLNRIHSANSCEIILGKEEINSVLKCCIDRLVFYGLANRMGNTLNFNAEPGIFPQLALEFWSG